MINVQTLNGLSLIFLMTSSNSSKTLGLADRVGTQEVESCPKQQFQDLDPLGRAALIINSSRSKSYDDEANLLVFLPLLKMNVLRQETHLTNIFKMLQEIRRRRRRELIRPVVVCVLFCFNLVSCVFLREKFGL